MDNLKLETSKSFPRLVRVVGQNEFLFDVLRSPTFGRTKKDADKIAAHIVKCVNLHEDLVNALQAIVNNWSERMHGETEELKPSRGEMPAYWSPSSSLVSSSVISNARKVLENIKP